MVRADCTWVVNDFWQDVEKLNRRNKINNSKVGVLTSLISAVSYNEEKYYSKKISENARAVKNKKRLTKVEDVYEFCFS